MRKDSFQENGLIRDFHFPEGFVFGAATSAYQIEGGANADGKGESNWDAFSRLENKIDRGETGETACDHYNRWRDDVAIMKRLGIESYRFSVSWARVLPAGTGKVNEAGVKFYSDLIDALLEAGIAPMLTIFHWDIPQALENKGGFLNPDSVDWYLTYAGLLFERFGDRVRDFITFNEPFVYTHFGYVGGNFPPGRRDDYTAKLLAGHNILKSHGAAVRLFREKVPGGRIGITLDYAPNVPARDTAEDRTAAARTNQYWAGWYYEPIVNGRYPAEAAAYYRSKGWFFAVSDEEMRRIAEPIDFLGINHYFSNYVEYRKGAGAAESALVDKRFEKNDLGWDITPDGFYWLLMYLKDTSPYPIYITENGISLNDIVLGDGKVYDYDRIDYLNRYLAALERAVRDGADVRGYYYWSLLDNFEWAAGYKGRFGLVHVDYKTQKRTIKESGRYYADLIRAHKVPKE